jgi:endonuclease/exonuclease/phosphatase family metal-dependent hydrolase
MKKFFRVILLIINLLFALLLVLSTLAGKVAPSRFVPISILSYGYFVLLLCNVLFVIIWLCLSRWEFLVSVAAIVLRLSFVPLFFQVGGNTDAEPADDVVKIMTFNTHGFGGLDSDTAMTKDSGAVIFLSIVDEVQPDVLCLQEFFSPRHVKVADSLKARGYVNHYGVHGQNPASQVILFTRLPMVRTHDMDKKSMFSVDVKKGDSEVRVCCVHLNSYQLTEEDMVGFESLSHAKPDSNTHRLLRKFKETTLQHEQEWKQELLPLVESSQLPFVLVGDFNDTPASYIYQQATELLIDPYVEQGRGFGTTYHGPYPAYRIDYVLHTPDLEALSYKRVNTYISDHYPVVVSLRLKGEK